MATEERAQRCIQRPGISISPTEIRKTDRERLLSQTCEQVIAQRAGEEAKRNDRMADNNENVGKQPMSSPPRRLMVALDVIHDTSGRSVSLIEKCLIHLGDALLSTIPEIKKTAGQYSELVALEGTNGELDDIIEQVKKDHYTVMGTPVKRRVNFVGAKKVISSINEQCKGLGLPMGMSVAMALMLAISTTNDETIAGTANGLIPEIDMFLRYVRERNHDMDAFYKKAHERLGTTNEKVVPWRHNIGICWTAAVQ